MTSKWFNTNRLLICLFLSSVFFLAITKINDTDTWMHLAFGRLIWLLKGLPSTEPFVYTNLGNPFTYTSWLFSVVYYLAYSAMNVYGVILLKAVAVTAIFFILLMDSLRPYRNYVVSIAVLIVMVFLLRDRFVERPEIFMMVFLSFSIFSLNAYIYENKKYIYFLPVVHLIWANCHSSINLMIIPFGAVLAGGYIQSYFKGKCVDFCCTPSRPQLRTILFIFLASFALTFLNPNFAEQYLYGYRMLSVPWYKQEIIELQAPTWQLTKWPYLISLSILLSFLINIKRISFINLLLSLPFIYLSFISVRFVYILGIVAAPILSNNISSILRFYSLDKYLVKKTSIAIASILAVLYPLFLIHDSNSYGNTKNTIGFGIDFRTVPENALRYMDRRGIYGRMFSNFEWGGYINWRDFPKRSVFLDPRGEIPLDLLDKFKLALSAPPVMNTFEETYNIKAVLIKYPAMADLYKEIGGSDVDPAFPNRDWALVYWDDEALVYLKRGGEYNEIIAQDEYTFVKPAKELNIFRSEPNNSTQLDNIIAELKRSIAETDSGLARYLLMHAFNEKGLYDEAIAAGEKYQKSGKPDHPEIFKHMAVAYEHIGNIDESIRYYKKALSIREDAGTLFALGKHYLNAGDPKSALFHFKKALDLDANLISIYPIMIRIYQESGDADNAAKMTKMFTDVQRKTLGDSHYKTGMQAYMAGNYMLAIEEFSKSLEYDPTNPTALSDLGYVYYDINQLDRAFEFHRKALAIDPNYANSYYGLALIFKQRGDLSSARTNWEKYLDLEPNGYFSRKASQEIEQIKE
jgi:tetratricopeptide (TPR) repeat protein